MPVIETDVRVVASPEQVLEVRPNRVVLQSRVNLGSTAQLIGVFVEVDGEQRIDVVSPRSEDLNGDESESQITSEASSPLISIQSLNPFTATRLP